MVPVPMRPSPRRGAIPRSTSAARSARKRSNETHASTTDPEARLYRKGDGMEARLCFMGHALMENRNGLIVDACVTQADGHAERIAALAMIEPWAKEIAGLGQTRFRGRARVGLAFTLVAAAYNLVRLPRLLGGGA